MKRIISFLVVLSLIFISNNVFASDPPVATHSSAAEPHASFTAKPLHGVVPHKVEFTNRATGNITEYFWDFGDGNTSTLKEPGHTYDTPGTFTVKLVVTGPGGSDTKIRRDYVITEAPTIFGPQQVIATELNKPNSVYSVDLDNDGDMDLLANSCYDFKIYWYENDGNQAFTEHLLARHPSPSRLVAVDMDNDGDMDVLVSSGSEHKISWLENDGEQNFTAHDVSDTDNYVLDYFVIDLDQDGDLDVISAIKSLRKDIVWYENDGSQNFTARIIARRIFMPIAFSAADFDGDNDLDVVVSDLPNSGGNLYLFENDSLMNFTKRKINQAQECIMYLVSVDLDRDNDTDIVCTTKSDDKLVWYQNNGEGNFSRTPVCSDISNACAISTSDLDSDDDIDLVSFSSDDNQITWHENDGFLNFTSHIVTIDAYHGGDVFVVDIDGDTDLDLVSASFYDRKLAWYENLLNPIIPAAIDSFSAEIVADQVLLKWIASSVPENSGFEVERRSESSDFETIGFVAVPDTESIATPYEFRDEGPLPGLNEYRLKQISGNDEYWYSDIVSVMFDSSDGIVMLANYPNPFNPVTTFSYRLQRASQVELGIYNIMGQRVATIVAGQQPAGVYKYQWNAANFASGVYFSRFKAGNVVRIHKLMLVK